METNPVIALIRESTWSCDGTGLSPLNIDCTGSKSFVRDEERNVFSKFLKTEKLKQQKLSLIFLKYFFGVKNYQSNVELHTHT